MSYRWVPSGFLPYTTTTQPFLYVRYERNRDLKQMDWVYNDDKYYVIAQFPDRTIAMGFLCDGRPVAEAPNDPMGVWDEVIHLGAFTPHSIVPNYLKYFMISSHNGLQWGINSRDWIENELILIADSGGAQLKMGTAEYVDPVHIIDWMNKSAHYGAALDVPPRPVDQTNLRVMIGLMEAQKRNNKIFLERRQAPLKLLNCIHGYTLQQARAWLKYVEEDGFHGWAAGADSSSSTLACVRNLLVPILESNISYNSKQPGDIFHLFGASGRLLIPGLAWVGKWVDNVTTDSTTYLAGVRTRQYMSMDLYGRMDGYNMGDNTDLKPLGRLPCNCQICSRVGYWDFFNLPSRTGTAGLLALHNMFTFANYANFWNCRAQEAVDLKAYEDSLRVTFDRVIEPLTLTRYVDCAFREGLDSADNRFRSALCDDPVKFQMAPLFGASADEQQGAQKNAMLNLQNFPSIEKVLLNYMSRQELDALPLVA